MQSENLSLLNVRGCCPKRGMYFRNCVFQNMVRVSNTQQLTHTRTQVEYTPPPRPLTNKSFFPFNSIVEKAEKNSTLKMCLCVANKGKLMNCCLNQLSLFSLCQIEKRSQLFPRSLFNLLRTETINVTC